MKKGITLGKLTGQFWDSLRDYQRGFLSLTYNKNNWHCEKKWKELTKKQQSEIFIHLWRKTK